MQEFMIELKEIWEGKDKRKTYNDQGKTSEDGTSMEWNRDVNEQNLEEY